MALPDPNANEQTVEIAPELWAKLIEAKTNAEAWGKIYDGYKAQVQTLLGSATAATVNGEKVALYRPSEKWAEARIVKDYPDLAQHFMTQETREVFALDQFIARHPEIAAQYRVRTFRQVTA